MFEQEGVAIRGVVLNKVKVDKLEKVREKMGKLLADRWGVPLLGVVPDLPFLGRATLEGLEQSLDATLVAGTKCRGLHYGQEDAFLITTGLRRYLRRCFQQREDLWRRPVFITHATRDDLLLGFLAHHQKKAVEQGGSVTGPTDWAGVMVLSVGASEMFPDLADHSDDREPLDYLIKMAVDTDAPVMITKLGTIDALDTITRFTAKHTIRDPGRIRAAIAHYEPQIDFDAMLNGT